mmetsp:Transcript_24862/g.59895  ORF Transcript_24862/g.59895 Transcript_24862/m.59895 type:complete len:206 (-) Transcript_24862:170-787(-)
MASVTALTNKRALKDVNVTDDDGSPSVVKKQKSTTAVGARKKDIQTIKSIIGDIYHPGIKAALENIIQNPTVAAPKKKDDATIEKLANKTVKSIQGLINGKLKWSNTFRNLKDGNKKGGRVEVVCTDPEVFERIFKDATIKKGKDGKMSCSAKTDGEAENWNLPFRGKSYRYDASYLHAPLSASLNGGTLSFSFKYSLECSGRLW